MAININRYVNIISGVGAGTQVSGRNFGLRIFTTNPLVPTKSFIEFNSATEVGTYFGTSSEEYTRAVFYFNWISKNITTNTLISYARWVDVASAPEIFGNIQSQSLSTYTAITSGSFGLTLGGVSHTFSSLDFSAAASLSDVATVIQTAIRTQSGTMWTAATVSYDASRGSFDFVGGATGSSTISVQQGVGGTPIAGIIGWLTGAILSNGSVVETITTTLTNSDTASTNFGSFLFIPDLDLSQITEAATWNDSLNVKYIYNVPVIASNASSYQAALAAIGGTGVTLSPLESEFPEMIPAMIFGATNYNSINSVQNYEFQQFNLTPSVIDDADANTYDSLLINYYGQTQTAGQLLSFYQKGVLLGLSTDPQDMNVYANEIWLKDSIVAAVMTVFLSLSQIPANSKGQSQILAVIQSVVDQAVNNGTIEAGKTLTPTQILYITTVTGDPNAWYQVQTLGYWLNVAIVTYVESSITKYKAVPTLVYSKNDVIRKVDGTDILI